MFTQNFITLQQCLSTVRPAKFQVDESFSEETHTGKQSQKAKTYWTLVCSVLSHFPFSLLLLEGKQHLLGWQTAQCPCYAQGERGPRKLTRRKVLLKYKKKKKKSQVSAKFCNTSIYSMNTYACWWYMLTNYRTGDTKAFLTDCSRSAYCTAPNSTSHTLAEELMLKEFLHRVLLLI